MFLVTWYLIVASCLDSKSYNICSFFQILSEIRPYLVGTGGGILELVQINDYVVKVRLSGPAAGVMTVRVALTQKLRDKIPSIAAVQLIDWCNIHTSSLYFDSSSVKEMKMEPIHRKIYTFVEKRNSVSVTQIYFPLPFTKKKKLLRYIWFDFASSALKQYSMGLFLT